jgi:transcriptional regulator GlxA family with amidase domain
MDARVESVIKIVRRGVGDQLSLRILSRSVNLSPSRLRQLFKMETGLSPMQYVKHVRLEKAANLLHTSFLSVKEVLFQSGARDASNFARDFRKQYGLTATEFRARSRSSPKAFCRASESGE